jgi:hypothetical protein
LAVKQFVSAYYKVRDGIVKGVGRAFPEGPPPADASEAQVCPTFGQKQ